MNQKNREMLVLKAFRKACRELPDAQKRINPLIVSTKVTVDLGNRIAEIQLIDKKE